MIKAETSPPKVPRKGSKGKKVPPKAKASGTKLGQLEALLRRPEGVSITLGLLRQYVAANFTLTNDGQGETLVSDPPLQNLAEQPFLTSSLVG